MSTDFEEGMIKSEHRQTMNEIASILSQCFPGRGFALLVFDLNASGGFLNYISNAERDDMCKALREFIARSEGMHHEEH